MKLKYTIPQYAVKAWLPLHVIQKATDENWLDSLCYWVWLKKIYNTSIFYNYSLRKVSALIACSPATLSHHLTILSKQGLCSVTDGHLHIINPRKLLIKGKRCLLVPVGVSNNKSIQRDLLRYTLYNRNFFLQTKAFNKKNESLLFVKGKKFSLKDTKRIQKRLNNYPLTPDFESSVDKKLTLSNKKFGSIINRSERTGIKMQQSMKKLKLLRSQKRVILIAVGYTRQMFYANNFNGSYFLSQTGCVYQRLTNSINLISHRDKLYSEQN